MLTFAVLGIILWILFLLRRIKTKTVAMSEKGEESPSGCGSPAAKEDIPATLSSCLGEQSLSTVATTSPHKEDNRPKASISSAGTQVTTVHTEVQQASSKANSEQTPLPSTTQKPPKTKVPMFRSGPEARKRLKFILGASEDNSSDDEPLATKPPSGASQPPISITKASPHQPQSISSRIK